MAKNKTTKNKTRKLKRYKKKDISQLIKIIFSQNKKQDELLKRIEELEEYLSFIEVNINNGDELARLEVRRQGLQHLLKDPEFI